MNENNFGKEVNRMTPNELCQRLVLSPDVTERVLRAEASLDVSALSGTILGLCDPTTSRASYEQLREALGNDPDGSKILTCYLLAAAKTLENYARVGIDSNVFFDTVGCFPRFIGETLERKGVLAFDRAHWAYRHLNMTLLRVGTLEYERREREGVRINAIHIPSDADLSPEVLDASLREARRLTRAYFPDYADAPFTCESWLMGESLCELLPPSSKILQFRSRFDILQKHPESDAYLPFIFHRADCSDYRTLPEDTSLQRNAKARLLSGRGIDGAFGVMRKEPT